MRTEHRDQASICPFALREVSVLAELTLGHLRYSLTDVPPQSNSPPGNVLGSDHAKDCWTSFQPRAADVARDPTPAEAGAEQLPQTPGAAESVAPSHVWFENCRDTAPTSRSSGHALRFTE